MNKSNNNSTVVGKKEQVREEKNAPKIKKEKRANFKQNWRNLLDRMED